MTTLPEVALDPATFNEDRDDGRLFNVDQYIPTGDPHRQALMLAYAFAASYENPRTARGHLQCLREFIAWMQAAIPALPPVSNDMRRGHLDAYKQWLVHEGRAPATIARKLAVLAGWYRYLVGDGFIDRDPTIGLRRPKVSQDSTTPFLDPRELADFLNLAERDADELGDDRSRTAFALAALLALNGLRISEALGADVTDLRHERYSNFLLVTRKGPKHELVPLQPRTLYAIHQAIGDRTAGPLLLNQRSNRMDRASASLVVRRLVAVVAPGKKISPHGIRHSAITALRYAGASLTVTQEFAGHADPRTTKRYDRRVTPPDGHGTFLLGASLASYPVATR